MRRVSILAVLVLLAPLALAGAQHVPGVERSLTTPREAIAGGRHFVTSATAAGDEFLVTWRSRSRSYATRLAPLSEARATSTVRIDMAGHLRVVAAGTHSIAVSNDGGLLYAGRLSEEGKVQERFSIGEVDAPDEEVSLLAANERAVLVVLQARSHNRVRARVLDDRGEPTTAWLNLGSTANGSAAAGADPEGFLVLKVANAGPFDLRPQVEGHRITLAGDVTRFVIPDPEVMIDGVVTAFDGANYLVAAYDHQPGTVRGTLVSPNLTVSQTFTLIPSGELPKALVGRSGGSLLFSARGAVTAAISIDHHEMRAGSPRDVADRPVEYAATNGSVVLAVWSTYPEEGVTGRWVDATTGLPLSAPFAIAIGAQDESQPAIALGAEVDLVVWQDAGIVAKRIAHDGHGLDSVPTRLSHEATSDERPAVTFDGTQFVIVWTEDDRLLGRRMRIDGSLTETFVIAEEHARTPAIASSEGITLVVWNGNGQILGVRMSQAGLVFDSVPLQISRQVTGQADVVVSDVIAGDGQFVVGWQMWSWPGGHAPRSTSSLFASVTVGGTITEPIALRVFAPGEAGGPQLAWNGVEFLAAWNESSTVFVQRITNGGTPIATPVPVPFSPIADATFFQGSWHLLFGATDTRSDWFISSDIGGAYLTPELEVERAFAAAATDDIEVEPAIASDGTRATIVYRRIVSTPPHNGSGAVRFRMYGEPQHGPARRRAVR